MSELKPQWIGVFVNADELEKSLNTSGGFLALGDFGITGAADIVLQRIKASLQTFGLEKHLDMPAVVEGIALNAALQLWVPGPFNSYLAATLAEAIRQELMYERKTFTFETVMSHDSKIASCEKPVSAATASTCISWQPTTQPSTSTG